MGVLYPPMPRGTGIADGIDIRYSTSSHTIDLTLDGGTTWVQKVTFVSGLCT
jgi:hypothetical protein